MFQDPGQYHNIEATLSSKQYGLKAGLKVFKSKGLAEISSEIEDNLHGRGVIEPAPANEVTGKIRKASLIPPSLISKKRMLSKSYSMRTMMTTKKRNSKVITRWRKSSFMTL